MSKRKQSKYKICRRLKINLWGRPKVRRTRANTAPACTASGRGRKLSSFGIQLQAKQKLKGYYGNITREAVPPHLRTCGAPAR